MLCHLLVNFHKSSPDQKGRNTGICLLVFLLTACHLFGSRMLHPVFEASSKHADVLRWMKGVSSEAVGVDVAIRNPFLGQGKPPATISLAVSSRLVEIVEATHPSPRFSTQSRT
eukprot:1361647-Rhodomonas_salina.1